jgi:hypothetical protein
MIPRSQLETIRAVNTQLTKETSLVIEESFYTKMVVRDVKYLRRNPFNCWESVA